MLDALSDKLEKVLKRLRGHGVLTEENIAEALKEVRVALLEADVNFRLQLFHADYAALRRYLVDEGMLSRAEGVYWRTGGRYEGATAPAEPNEA